MSFKHSTYRTYALVALVERSRNVVHHGKTLISVVGHGLDVTEVNTNLFVVVSYRDVERKVVIESSVCGVVSEIEFCEWGVGDGEFELLGKKDQPEDEHGDGEDEEYEGGVGHEAKVALETPVTAVPTSNHGES